MIHFHTNHKKTLGDVFSRVSNNVLYFPSITERGILPRRQELIHGVYNYCSHAQGTGSLTGEQWFEE